MSDSDSWQDSSSDSDTDQRSGDSDDSAPELSDVRTWCPIDCGMDEVPPPRFPSTGSPGMKVDVEHNDPLAYLKLFLTDDIIEKIVTETNRYNKQQSATLHSKFSRNRKWEPVTKEDIWKFLGLILLSGVVRKPLQKWYWTTNKLLATPFFGTIMSECRFSLIMKNLHFTNNEEFDKATHPAPKLKKIWEVYQMIIKNFQQSYVPDRDISIDESLMAYKGRLSWIQYIASKRAQFGIKSYMLCESATGYIWNSVIYTAPVFLDVMTDGIMLAKGAEGQTNHHHLPLFEMCRIDGCQRSHGVNYYGGHANHLMMHPDKNPED
ncbi:piggyBac transposable element-derived protein 4-like [Gastrophryne carolinensis]